MNEPTCRKCHGYLVKDDYYDGLSTDGDNSWCEGIRCMNCGLVDWGKEEEVFA